ncbi:MAG: hypothetical protein HDT18_00345 [Oscillibacter sp.]|nr:hypothetical protein [Oscillibacter sp.]
MNYTEKYHLPQWDETDRILRVDFNQMCLNIEKGLRQNATGSAEASEQIAADIAEAVQTVENKAFDQACRLAYNHYCFAQTLTPFPRQAGVFHLDTSLADTGLSGLVKYHDYYQMNYAASTSENQLLSMMDQTEMSVSGSTTLQALTAAFTAPSNGLIQSFLLYAQFYDLSSGITVFPCELKYTDLTDNQTILTTDITLNLNGKSGTLSQTIQEPLLIACGHKYQVTVTPTSPRLLDGSVSGRFARLSFTSGATGAKATASCSFQNPGENLGLVAVASYQFTANCPTPKLLAGGQEVPLWWSRTVEDGKGNNIQEAVFRSNDTVKDNETLQLQLSCGQNETLTLYSWGVTLI